jgi:hypothetical protein
VGLSVGSTETNSGQVPSAMTRTIRVLGFAFTGAVVVPAVMWTSILGGEFLNRSRAIRPLPYLHWSFHLPRSSLSGAGCSAFSGLSDAP